MKHLLSILIFLSFMSLASADETVYCKYSTGKSYPSHQCSVVQTEITNEEFCNQQRSDPNLMGYVINKHCYGNLITKDYSTITDKKICRILINGDGTINNENEKVTKESINRDLSIEDCKILTGRFTKEEKQYKENQARVAQKKAKINQMKLDCEDLGFTKDTEGMGNCVLKLMELERDNTVTTSYSSGSSTEILDIEREKLEALKRQTEKTQNKSNGWRTLYNMGQALQNSTNSSSGSQVCHYQRKDQQAFNTICYYSCTGTIVSHNLNSGTALCPMSINR